MTMAVSELAFPKERDAAAKGGFEDLDSIVEAVGDGDPADLARVNDFDGRHSVVKTLGARGMDGLRLLRAWWKVGRGSGWFRN